MKKVLAFLGVLAVVWTVSPFHGTALAGDDVASPIIVDEWIKQGPIDLIEGRGEKVYLIEFWATWCPPCRESIPHLTKIQRAYRGKGLIVVGISDEDAETVTRFVKDKGDEMDYAVAADPEYKTISNYMGKYGVGGIPTAFLVDRGGRVVWYGHPLDPQMESRLSGLLEQPAAARPNDTAPRADKEKESR
jgi:thiol-disulfide isomerase/thioredoxin